MARQNRRKPNKKRAHSQQMSHLKAIALTKVARQAWNNDQRYKTIALLTEALRREPSNPEILVELATACGKQRYYKRAEELLSRLIETAPRSSSMFRRVGLAYSIIDRPERAAEFLRRSLELNSQPAKKVATLLDLADLCERSHQLDESRQLVSDACQLEPSNQRARLLGAVLDRRQGDVTNAEAHFRDLLSNEDCLTSIRVQAGYELAQLLDNEEHYDAAFAGLLAAKKLMKPHAAGQIQQRRITLNKNEEMLGMLDEACYDRWQESVAPQDFNYRIAILTSHPRSGTTLVEQILDSHEQVKSADEFDVFSQWVHQPIFRRFPPSLPVLSVLEHVPRAVRLQARASYWQQTEAIFEESLGERLLVDKNPGMTIMLPVINWAFPEMRILFALRDPRDVILSCFMQKVPLTPISSAWLSLTDAAEYYARSTTTWLKTRDLTKSPWLEFRYEDVVADMRKEAQRIMGFLELPWDEHVLRFHEHAKEKVVRSPTYKDVTQPVYRRSIGRWRHYASQLEPVLDKLRPFVTEFGYSSH